MRPTGFLVIPLTAEANQWLDTNIDYRMMDERIPFDHQHVEAIPAGLKEAGFKIVMRSRASGGWAP